MALPHAAPGQVIDLQPLGDALAEARTTALFKSDDLELMRLVLPAGKSLPMHAVAGEITVQCIEGEIDVSTEAASHVLRAGQLLYLRRGVPHGVRALRDASALVTVVLRRG